VNSLFLQLSRFAIVGVIAALVHFCVVILLVQDAQMAPLLANGVAYLCAFQVSYWGHRVWTFAATHVLHQAALPKLFLAQTITFCANESLFYVFLLLKLPYPVALLIVLSVLPLFSFLAGKYWVFESRA
jgi:putative flippase GtrA